MELLLILRSQTYPDVAKAQTHKYMYTLYLSLAAFYECLITVVITLLRSTAAQKKFMYYPQICVNIYVLTYFQSFC